MVMLAQFMCCAYLVMLDSGSQDVSIQWSADEVPLADQDGNDGRPNPQ